MKGDELVITVVDGKKYYSFDGGRVFLTAMAIRSILKPKPKKKRKVKK